MMLRAARQLTWRPHSLCRVLSSAPAPAVITRDDRGVVTAVAEVAGRRLTLQHGKVAPLADCAVMATYGDTSMLVTAVSPMLIEGPPDGLPLTVDYREMWFASGIIPGSFNRKEKYVGSRLQPAPSVLPSAGDDIITPLQCLLHPLCAPTHAPCATQHE
jgi:hypothetical protein